MQPKTKASELVDRISSYAKSKERDEITRPGILRDIEALQKVEPGTASACRGMMAALDRDEQATRRHFDNARRLQPHDWWIELNYSHALHNLGYNGDATSTARVIYDSDNSNLVVLDQLIYFAVVSGRAFEASRLLERRTHLKPKAGHPHGDAVKQLSAFYDRHELQEDDVEALFKLTIDVLHEAGYYHDLEDFGVRRDGESEWFSGRLEVVAPVETIVDLNMQLADMQSSSEFSPELMTLVNFMFVPASI